MKKIQQNLTFAIPLMTSGMINDLKKRIKRGLTKEEKRLFAKYIAHIKKFPNE